MLVIVFLVFLAYLFWCVHRSERAISIKMLDYIFVAFALAMVIYQWVRGT